MANGRNSGRGRPRGFVTGIVGRQNVPNASLKQFTPRYQSTVRRHQWTQATPTAEPAASSGLSAIAPDQYWIERCFRMNRTFGSPTPDVEPTPSQSNNFRDDSVMNGSLVEDFDMVCRIKNTSATVSPTIDVYKMCFSFWDALIWQTVSPSNNAISFSTASPDEGVAYEVTPIVAGRVDTDIIENFKFHQHYLEKVAEITIGNTDTDNVAEFRVRGVPSKVKRMQTGAYYGYLFHNSSDKNGGATWNFEYSVTKNFTEIPSGIRPPYVL